MARPAVAAEDRLIGHLRARCTDVEENLVAARAAANGLTPSEYVRQASIRAKVIVVQQRAPDFAMAAELRRIGNNLNQLVAAYHLSGDVPVDLQRLWAKLEELLDRIIAAEGR